MTLLRVATIARTFDIHRIFSGPDQKRCALRCLSIYQLFCLVQFFLKIWIPYSTILHQINRTFEKILESEFELEIILSINH